VIIGAPARHVPEEHAWDVVAGLTVGQDLSDRDIQWRPKSSPQFSLCKSPAGFAPLGPVLATPDDSPTAMTRTPPRYLVSGDRLESWIEGIGSMSHTFVGDSNARLRN
jgi:2-keto-4-pentenoate hydratase/2-oxohepta-3-ene-1,7-dioic acid hydratase in catechol pathway